MKIGIILVVAYFLFMAWVFWTLKETKTCPHCGATKYDENGEDNFICVGYDCKYKKCKQCDNRI